MKTYSEARIELRNLQFWKKMLEKSSQFLSWSDQPSEPISLDVTLNIAGVETYARKTCDCGQPGGHSMRVLTERKGALVTVEICVLCGRWFANQFEIMSETPFRCDAVNRELLWAVLCSLLCRELDWNIRIGKQGYMQCLSDFTTVFVDTRLWKTKHLRKRFQHFRQSYVFSTDRIEIHQSQPLVWPSDFLYVMLAGYDWWISIRHVDNT